MGRKFLANDIIVTFLAADDALWALVVSHGLLPLELGQAMLAFILNAISVIVHRLFNKAFIRFAIDFKRVQNIPDISAKLFEKGTLAPFSEAFSRQAVFAVNLIASFALHGRHWQVFTAEACQICNYVDLIIYIVKVEDGLWLYLHAELFHGLQLVIVGLLLNLGYCFFCVHLNYIFKSLLLMRPFK
jgi:hypothetical protein